MLKKILRISLIFVFILIFFILYYYYLSFIFLSPNNLEEKVSNVMILGFFTVIIGFFLFTILNLENKNFMRFKFISEDGVKFILLILMIIAFLIPPIKNSSTISYWEEINSFNLFRAIIYIIGASFLPGACLFKVFFPKSTLHERFNIESFFLKITLYPILSFTFIGVCVLVLDVIRLLKEFFPLILLLTILGLFFSNLIIQYKRDDNPSLKFEDLKISKNTFIILIIASGISIFAIGIFLSVGYLIKGDAWVGLGSANFIGKSQISPIDYGKTQNYPVFWGYVIFGLSSLTGIPFINTNALLAPFCYLSITSMYLFLKSILDKYNEAYSILSTILIAIYGGIFCFYPLIINNWGAISHYTFRSQFNFDYKNFAYNVLYLSLGFFFIKSDEKFDIIKIKYYKSEEFKILFLSSYLLIISFITYMIPLIVGIYMILLYCLFSDKKIRKKKFQSFKLHLILMFILFFIIDISLELLYSRLYYIKYSKYFYFGDIFDKIFFTYGSFLGLFLFISVIQLISTKSLLDRYKQQFNLNFNYVLIPFYTLFTLFVLLNIYNIFYIHNAYKYTFIYKNYWYYALFYLFLNIGIIGIIGIYLSYFCFKKYKNLFYFLISWIIVSISISLYLIFRFSFPINEISIAEYRIGLNWFNKYWIFSMPALSILASIGSIEFLKFLKFSQKISGIQLNLRNKNFVSILKLTIVSLLVIISYSNIFIAGAIRGNSNERLTEEKVKVLGWVVENLDHDSKFLIERDYDIYTIISSFLDRESCYYLRNYGAKSGLFDENLPYIEQIDEIERRDIRYAILYVNGYPRTSYKDTDFIENYLLVKVFTKELYRYGNLAVFYAPNIENLGYYEPRNYSGTFSFDKEEIGTEPLGWDVSPASTTSYVKVVDNYFGHAKILQVYDNSETKNAFAIQSFNSSMQNGTLEFWVFYNDPSDFVTFSLKGKNLNGPKLYLGNYEWKYHNGVEYTKLPRVYKPSGYKWHHVRIDFECGIGEYLGLKANKYRFIIDGISSGDFDLYDNPKSLNKLEIETGVIKQEYLHLYLDAIGYSWDVNYKIGDNLL